MGTTVACEEPLADAGYMVPTTGIDGSLGRGIGGTGARVLEISGSTGGRLHGW